MRKPEFWVMRVVLHHARERTLAAHVATLALVDAGTYVQLPAGDIAEPVEVFDSELEAQAHRAELLKKHPSEDFRVVLNADVSPERD